MEYEVYRNNDATEEAFTYISDFFKVVLKEDKDLCNGAQKNLQAGVFLNGELHPHAEKVSQTCVIQFLNAATSETDTIG
jgi:hypothetical protein